MHVGSFPDSENASHQQISSWSADAWKIGRTSRRLTSRIWCSSALPPWALRLEDTRKPGGRSTDGGIYI